MSSNYINSKVKNWAEKHAANGDVFKRDSIRTILQHLYFLERKLYFQYEPCQPPYPGYWERLKDWLNNFSSEEDQQLAFELAAKLYFIGREEIKVMYRSAFSGPVMRWLITTQKFSLIDHNLSNNLEDSVKSTWFCPITDSMKINEFIHVNKIRNDLNYRPDWHSLTEFGSELEITNYIINQSIKRIVLLEDFIATGTQARDAIRFAANICNKSGIPLLIVPLIQSYQSVETFLNSQFPTFVTIDPVLLLKAKDFILEDATNSQAIFDSIRLLAEKTYLQVTDGEPPGKNKPYHPLGFGKTGGLVVLGTNTPDNTLPLIHWKSSKWTPLFPRHSRV